MELVRDEAFQDGMEKGMEKGIEKGRAEGEARGETRDIANMTAFYVSGKADYVTGQIIRVNGGWYI